MVIQLPDIESFVAEAKEAGATRVYAVRKYLKMIEQFLGEEAGLEATLHLLQDWGWIEKEDYAFYRPRPAGRRK